MFASPNRRITTVTLTPTLSLPQHQRILPTCVHSTHGKYRKQNTVLFVYKAPAVYSVPQGRAAARRLRADVQPPRTHTRWSDALQGLAATIIRLINPGGQRVWNQWCGLGKPNPASPAAPPSHRSLAHGPTPGRGRPAVWSGGVGKRACPVLAHLEPPPPYPAAPLFGTLPNEASCTVSV